MKLYRGTEHVGTTAPDRPAEQRSVAGFALESLHRLAVSFRSLRSLGPGLKSGLALLMAVLREIFDESAYVRFLNRKQIASSPEAYAGFLQECDVPEARRPRCC